MEAAKNRRRLIVLTSIVALCFVGLGCRLVDLQWAHHEELAQLAEDQHDSFYYREAQRGPILDRRGNTLATSVPVKRICADPFILKSQEADLARFLAPLLKTNETALLHALSRTHVNKAGARVPVRYVVLKNKVAVDDWEKIHAAMTNQFVALVAGQKLSKTNFADLKLAWTSAIYAQEDQIRTYPNAQLAAHVLGFTGFKEVVAHGRTNSIPVGVEGIEATFDEKLHGAPGWVKTEVSGRKQELFMFREQDVEARPGLGVILTLDSRVQQIVEEELAPAMAKHSPQSVSAIIVRPRTGEILAMATLPTFDPNKPGASADAARRNRPITDTFEPGSTFKTVTISGAFNDGLVRLTDRFDCENGAFRFAGYTLHDHKFYGVLTVQQIVAESSNIGTAKVAIKMGQERAYKYITDFGFGQRTGIPLTGEAYNILPKLEKWQPISISRIPIGQGVTVTPLQTAMAFCAVANGGTLLRPMIVDSLVDDKGNVVAKYQPQVVRRVISEAAAKTMTQALKSVVEKGGTAAETAALEHYTVAGKTGTAQKVVNKAYSHSDFYASFVGFFPADNPELCIYVGVDEPRHGYYGAQVAAPIFKRIAERVANFLNIKPDVQPGRPGEVMGMERTPEHGAIARAKL